MHPIDRSHARDAAPGLGPITVIVAHYAPARDGGQSHRALEHTLGSLLDPAISEPPVVLVCDDGSPAHGVLEQPDEGGALRREDANGRSVSVRPLDDPAIRSLGVRVPAGLQGSWLYLPKHRRAMCKARLWNLAARLAPGERLVFLDDDHGFVTDEPLRHFAELLERFPIVIGQVVGRSGRARPFSSRRVQGTTFALSASMLEACGGFGEWTEEVSCGIDSDLWWKLYRRTARLSGPQACYTSTIRTIDSISKRWQSYSGRWTRRRALRRAFEAQHRCVNYRDPEQNPSRRKELWMVDLTESAET